MLDNYRVLPSRKGCKAHIVNIRAAGLRLVLLQRARGALGKRKQTDIGTDYSHTGINTMGFILFCMWMHSD